MQFSMNLNIIIWTAQQPYHQFIVSSFGRSTQDSKYRPWPATASHPWLLFHQPRLAQLTPGILWKYFYCTLDTNKKSLVRRQRFLQLHMAVQQVLPMSSRARFSSVASVGLPTCQKCGVFVLRLIVSAQFIMVGMYYINCRLLIIKRGLFISFYFLFTFLRCFVSYCLFIPWFQLRSSFLAFRFTCFTYINCD